MGMIQENGTRESGGIVLATANARYHHASLALRCLAAGMGPLAGRASLFEFHISQRPTDAAEAILARSPAIVALGVYIWNADFTLALATIIKKVRPEVILVLGGPEVSFPDDPPPVAMLADHVVTGEGEIVFPALCETLLAGGTAPRLIEGGTVDLEGVALPYEQYTDEDIAHRTLYVETTRGCPMGCEFCLSSLDPGVRRFTIDGVLKHLDLLWERGARKFKFVDRALNFGVSDEVIEWLAGRSDQGIFVHFELVPHRVPERIYQALARFPEGSVQLEMGVQSLDPGVTDLICRKQDPIEVEHTIRRLAEETGCHLHADLVVGLPSQTEEILARDFDRLMATGVHEIQVGILKRLRGAPISRHDVPFGMIYNSAPPYEILKNDLIGFEAMQRLKRFAAYFDRVFNSGRFPRTTGLLLEGGSPFEAFSKFSDGAYGALGATHGISADRLARCLMDHLVTEGGRRLDAVADTLMEDYASRGMRRIPEFIRSAATPGNPGAVNTGSEGDNGLPARQRRHKRSRMGR